MSMNYSKLLIELKCELFQSLNNKYLKNFKEIKY